MYKKIIFATDGSENANRALKRIVKFYKAWGSEILVIHSLKHETLISFAYETNAALLQMYMSLEQENVNMGNEILYETKKFFEKASVPVELCLVVDESPEAFINRIVKEKNYDLVVLGIKGIHSKLKRALYYGSVAKKVIKNVNCDILIIK